MPQQHLIHGQRLAGMIARLRRRTAGTRHAIRVSRALPAIRRSVIGRRHASSRGSPGRLCYDMCVWMFDSES